MSAHDRWLANYSYSHETMWCQRPICPNSEDGITVLYEEEYGQAAVTPSDCPLCHGPLTFDGPPEAL